MTDRELLVIAARAADLNYTMFAALKELDTEQWGMVSFLGHGHVKFWNPLASDGDALRLARKCYICIEFGYCSDDAPVVRCGEVHDHADWPMVCNFPDPGKATRRAIVEAAVAKQVEYELAVAG